MRRRGLRTVIAKLEARKRLKRSIAPIIFTLYPEEGAGEIVGLASGKETVSRLYGEASLSGFAARASAALGGARIMFACHAPPEPPAAIL